MLLIVCLLCYDRCPGFRQEKHPLLFFNVSCLLCSDNFCTLKVFTIVSSFAKQATQFFFFSSDNRSVAMAAISSSFYFRVSFCATSPLSLKPDFTRKLLSSVETSLRRNGTRSYILSPKILLPSSSLSKAPVFVNNTLNTFSGIEDSTNGNNIAAYLSEVIPIHSKARKYDSRLSRTTAVSRFAQLSVELLLQTLEAPSHSTLSAILLQTCCSGFR